MTKSKKRKTKSKGLKHKRQGLRSIKRCKRCKKTQGGTQKVLISVQPSALGLREDREWLVNNVEHADKHNVSKLVSKVFTDNESSIDIDERLAEIIEGYKNSDKLLRPVHGKLLTTTIT